MESKYTKIKIMQKLTKPDIKYNHLEQRLLDLGFDPDIIKENYNGKDIEFEMAKKIAELENKYYENFKKRVAFEDRYF